MNCSVTISAEDFKNIHNGMSYLRMYLDQLEDVLNPQLFNRLVKAKNLISEGLVDAYRQESEDFDRKSNHYGEVAKSLGLSTTWSVHSVEDLNEQHPYQEINRLKYSNVSIPIQGPTWKDLYATADKAIKMSGDSHHSFIEDFRVMTSDGAKVLGMTTGS